MRLPRWPFLALLVGIACCSQGGGTLGELQADTPTESVRIFLIETRKGGILGKTGCGGAVPVEVELPRRVPALGGALEALLARQGDAQDPRSGLYNALHASPLRISNLQRRGGELRVRLEGYLELGDACDGPRAAVALIDDVDRAHRRPRCRWGAESATKSSIRSTGGGSSSCCRSPVRRRAARMARKFGNVAEPVCSIRARVARLTPARSANVCWVKFW